MLVGQEFLLGKDDMIIPEAKTKLVDDTRELIKNYEKQYSDGLITQGEKYNKVIDAWSKCTDNVADKMMNEMSIGKGETMNLSVYDGRLRCKRLYSSNETTSRYAWFNG